GLADVGGYYRDYVRLMAHIDALQLGRVHRVIHEALLDNAEAEVRALLAWLGQPFEEACMAFHTNARAVRTASSEQVRRPINRDGVGQWQPYEK
ncbi:sulfotransferase, partial [Klebsiella pneumoniae]|nr:sulfotransferase [Klebsiella pneumoniae]